MEETQCRLPGGMLLCTPRYGEKGAARSQCFRPAGSGRAFPLFPKRGHVRMLRQLFLADARRRQAGLCQRLAGCFRRRMLQLRRHRLRAAPGSARRRKTKKILELSGASEDCSSVTLHWRKLPPGCRRHSGLQHFRGRTGGCRSAGRLQGRLGNALLDGTRSAGKPDVYVPARRH